MTKTSHYYSEKPTTDLRPQQFTFVLRGISLIFHSGSGVFSKDHIDTGTKLLCDKVEIEKGSRVLDMGCGYGPLGIAIASTTNSEVVMCDINERAINLAKKNSKANKVKTTVVKSFLYENIQGEFDLILTNPPQSAGKDICQRMMDEGLAHLKVGGQFVFVARHKKGGRSLSEHLKESYGNLEIVAKGSGFRVYSARKTKE